LNSKIVLLVSAIIVAVLIFGCTQTQDTNTPVSGSSNCGDSTCDTGESAVTCPQDCPTEPAPNPLPGVIEVCGDGTCGSGENYSTCPQDCEKPIETKTIYPGDFFWVTGGTQHPEEQLIITLVEVTPPTYANPNIPTFNIRDVDGVLATMQQVPPGDLQDLFGKSILGESVIVESAGYDAQLKKSFAVVTK